MFDFEKLEVYQNIRVLNKSLLSFIFEIQNKNSYLTDQLKRAGLSVQLNLAEGTGRMSTADKKRFYIVSRSSVFECVSILQTFKDLELIDLEKYEDLYKQYETISKMLLGMIRNLKDFKD